MSLRSFLSVGDIRWLVKDMFKLGLLLNDVPVFHENRFEIGCGLIASIVGSTPRNGKISFVCFVSVRRASFLSVNLTSVSIS